MSESTTAREQRAARNQSVFREVNERLDERVAPDELSRFVCECASLDCVEQIELTIEEYEDVRADGTTFAVAPGHVYADVERVLGERDRFTVVQKVDAGAEVSQAHYARDARDEVSRVGER